MEAILGRLLRVPQLFERNHCGAFGITQRSWPGHANFPRLGSHNFCYGRVDARPPSTLLTHSTRHVLRRRPSIIQAHAGRDSCPDGQLGVQYLFMFHFGSDERARAEPCVDGQRQHAAVGGRYTHPCGCKPQRRDSEQHCLWSGRVSNQQCDGRPQDVRLVCHPDSSWLRQQHVIIDGWKQQPYSISFPRDEILRACAQQGRGGRFIIRICVYIATTTAV
mmetsp:Transcript_10964/g.18760  ORF Transcript_10964/g.18760 Transcript_10964/m.18760 type:complete len:220 (-) Transcript_10964:41-700(-)